MSCHLYGFFEKIICLLMRAGKSLRLSWADNKLHILCRKEVMIVERMKNGKRFVRYKEGAEMYSMCQSKFEQMAKDAKAIYKVDKLVFVNCDIFEQYLETFRLYV